MRREDGHLEGVGARDEVDGAPKAEERLARIPPADDLVLHHGGVRDRAAERAGAPAQEERRQLAKARTAPVC